MHDHSSIMYTNTSTTGIQQHVALIPGCVRPIVCLMLWMVYADVFFHLILYEWRNCGLHMSHYNDSRGGHR